MNRRLLIAIAVLVAPGTGHGAIPQHDGYEHLGVQSCAASSCHGSAGARNTYAVLQNEYITWARHDLHARAYRVLLEDRSKKIAANLGLEAAHTAGICLDCHADYVPGERRGLQFQLSDGVSCEACHGGAEKWLGIHIGGGGDKHARSLAAGLYPTEDPQARAELCLSCHLGTRDKFATHEIMGAGHPRLSFDLQKFTDIQPRHYRVDEDYRARKQFVEDTRVWAIGQVSAARQYLSLLQGPRLAGDGLFPELALFDCHACHHSMKEPRWQPDARSATPPGAVMLNDSSLAMSQAIAGVVMPRLGLPDGIRELHRASQTDTRALRDAAARLDGQLTQLAERLRSISFGAQQNGQVMDALIAALSENRYDDYSDAEQATMALDVYAGVTGRYRGEVDGLYEAMADEDRFDPFALSAIFTGVAPVVTDAARVETLADPRAPTVAPGARTAPSPGADGRNRTVSATALRVRSRPDATAPVQSTLYFGDAVQVAETRGDWSRIIFSGGEGWVASRYLSD